MTEFGICRGCGTREHLHLLDCKPEPGTPKKKRESADFTWMGCIACYGPGWCPTGGADDIKLSVAPHLASRYAAWKKRNT